MLRIARETFALTPLAYGLLCVLGACEEGAIRTTTEPSASASVSKASEAGESSAIAIKVSDDGFSPSEVRVHQGERTLLRFTRTTESECLSAVRLPWMTEAKPLPLHVPVDIPIPTEKQGAIVYACWMNMVFGRVIVEGPADAESVRQRR